MKRIIVIPLLIFLLAPMLSGQENVNEERIKEQLHALDGSKGPSQQQQAPTQAQTPSQQQQKPTQAQTPSQQQQKPTQAQTPSQQQQTGKVGPKWRIGMRWFVETKNTQSQQPTQKQKNKPVIWMFTVIAENRVEGRDCFQVKIQCEDKAQNQPIVYIWVDKQTGMLARMTTQVYVKNQWRSFTETYINRSGKPTAVFGGIPSLPLDMPLFFDETGSKDLDADGMTYEIVQGNTGTKSLGEVGFAYKVNQTIKPLSSDGSKSLEGANGLNLQEAIEVEMQGGTSGSVRQIWTPDTPWPIYSNNGSSESKLLTIEYPQP